MIRIESFHEYALALPETTVEPHFEIISFRIKKKIFATLNVPENRATLRFSPEMQDIFSSVSKGSIFPVPNKWGKYGWTNIDLLKVEETLLKDALQIAWREVAPTAFQKKYPSFYEDDI